MVRHIGFIEEVICGILEKQAGKWNPVALGGLGGASVGAVSGAFVPKEDNESRTARILAGAGIGGGLGAGVGKITKMMRAKPNKSMPKQNTGQAKSMPTNPNTTNTAATNNIPVVRNLPNKDIRSGGHGKEPYLQHRRLMYPDSAVDVTKAKRDKLYKKINDSYGKNLRSIPEYRPLPEDIKIDYPTAKEYYGTFWGAAKKTRDERIGRVGNIADKKLEDISYRRVNLLRNKPF